MLTGYQITGLIGQGGFGVVYVGRDTPAGARWRSRSFCRRPSPVAPVMAALPAFGRLCQRLRDWSQGFSREANLLAEFAHPALVAVHRPGSRTAPPTWRCSTTRQTLREVRLRAPPVRPRRRFSRGWRRFSRRSRAARPPRVIHRDISPDNILVMPDGATVLLDLGAARQVLGGMTQALTTILKPGFAPIEQYVEDGSMEQGRWTDVYGLGAVIYFGTGRPPTPATSRIVRDSMPPLHEAAPAAGYSPALLTRSAGRSQSGRLIVSKAWPNSGLRSAGSNSRVVAQAAEVTSTATPLATAQRVSLTAPLARQQRRQLRRQSPTRPAKADLRGKGANYPPSSGQRQVGSAGRGCGSGRCWCLVCVALSLSPTRVIVFGRQHSWPV